MTAVKTRMRGAISTGLESVFISPTTGGDSEGVPRSREGWAGFILEAAVGVVRGWSFSLIFDTEGWSSARARICDSP
jgi:hypothetical protein